MCCNVLCLAMQSDKDPLNTLEKEISDYAHIIGKNLKQLHPQSTLDEKQEQDTVEEDQSSFGTTVIREDIKHTRETLKNINVQTKSPRSKRRRRTVMSVYNQVKQEIPDQKAEEKPSTAHSGNQAKSEKDINTTTQVPAQEAEEAPPRTEQKPNEKKKQLSSSSWLSKRWVHVGFSLGVLSLLGYWCYKKSASHTPVQSIRT